MAPIGRMKSFAHAKSMERADLWDRYNLHNLYVTYAFDSAHEKLSSTSESKSNFCRSIRLAQSNRTAGRPKYKSVDPNCFIRRSLHAPNQMIRFGSCKVRRMNRALYAL